MTHLTEYSSVGRSDTLDSLDGGIGIVANIHCGVAVKVNVLCSDLTVLCKLLDKACGSYEASLAV